MALEANDAAGSSLYKYVNIAGLRRILLGSIRFTQPSAFNDPFELLPEIVISVDEIEKPICIAFDIAAKRRQPPTGASIRLRMLQSRWPSSAPSRTNGHMSRRSG